MKRPSPRRAAATLRFAARLRPLPLRVAHFYWRADRVAHRTGDRFSLDSAARPGELAALLRLARGRKQVVELGTGTAWTTIAFALTGQAVRVTSFDPIVRPQRDLYLELVDPSVRERIRLIDRAGSEGADAVERADLLFIDSSHDRDETVAEFEAWRPRFGADTVVAFHDYRHPDYPGVAEAVSRLGLAGDVDGGMFVWRRSDEPAG